MNKRIIEPAKSMAIPSGMTGMDAQKEPFIALEAFKSPSTLIWLMLIAISGLSFWLGLDHGTEIPHADDVVMRALIVVAFVKIRFVVMSFMGVRGAPWSLRLMLEFWIIGVCAVLLVLYSIGLPS